MAKNRGAAFAVDPDTEARMAALREQDEQAGQAVAPQGQEDFDPFGEAVDLQEIDELKKRISALETENKSLTNARDVALTALALAAKSTPAAGLTRNQDNSITLPVVVAADYTAMAEDWAQQSGMPLDEFLRREVGLALEAYWGGQ